MERRSGAHLRDPARLRAGSRATDDDATVRQRIMGDGAWIGGKVIGDR
jgi:hypothetical protein